MPPENDNQPETQPETVEPTEKPKPQPIYVTEEQLTAKFTAIEETLNKAINGVAKKFKAERETKAPDATPDSPQAITVDALKSDYEKQIADLRIESTNAIASLKAELGQKDQSEFLAGVRSRISEGFAKKGFEDVSSALEVFYSLHKEENYQKGSDGFIIYKKDGTDAGTTLENLINEWSKSAIGKRFLSSPSIPNGSGVQERKAPTEGNGSDAGLSRTQKLLKTRTFQS